MNLTTEERADLLKALEMRLNFLRQLRSHWIEGSPGHKEADEDVLRVFKLYTRIKFGG